LRTAPLSFTIGLNELQPGAYECQATVLDPTAQKGAFWRTPIVVAR
jgi:hypothetical protein